MHVSRTRRLKRALPLAAIGLATLALGACGSGSNSATTGTGAPAAGAPSASSTRVLPVPKNPISNTATAPGLTITKALVENNVSPDTGKGIPDHLEITLKNTTAKPLDQIGVYYKITDPAKKVSEGYFTKLDQITIAAGASQVVNFDETAGKGHFPVNKYSLYYTDKNALVVDITASAPNVKPATFTVKKDSGGAEAGVE